MKLFVFICEQTHDDDFMITRTYFSRYAAAVVFWACFISLLTLHSAQADTSLGHYDPTANTANTLVSGIMSYVYWDKTVQSISFCSVDGPAQAIDGFLFQPPSALLKPYTVKTQTYTSQQLLKNPQLLKNCRVLYFAKTKDTIQQQIINQTSQVLSISENNPNCTIGSAFCIYTDKNHYRFKVNLSALYRSKIQVNSKVLSLAQLQDKE